MRITERMNRNFFIKALVWAVLFLLLYTVTIQYQVVCELGGSWRTPVSLKTPVDAYTPVNIYIMWFYAACLLYVPFSGALFALNRRITAIQVVAFYLSVIAVYLLSYAIYLVFPTTAAEVMLTSYEPNKDLFINRGMFDALAKPLRAEHPTGRLPKLARGSASRDGSISVALLAVAARGLRTARIPGRRGHLRSEVSHRDGISRRRSHGRLRVAGHLLVATSGVESL
ncbi:MAG: hypothetical protein V9E81_04535 [Marmoricola sp.]